MIYILIPIYNEEKNIPSLYHDLTSVLPDEKKYYVFSDDGSNDNTIPLLHNYFKETEYIILGDGINRGPGYAFNVGFEWILKHAQLDDDIVVTMEADGTSDIRILPTMVAIEKLGFDLVLASVYAQGGGFDNTTFIRRFLSFGANVMFRLMFKINVLTLSSFYRVYNVGILKKVQKNYGTIIEERGFICMLEILIKCIDSGAKIIEVPMVLHSSKRKGKSKMKLVKTFIQYLLFLIRTKRKSF